MSDSVGSVSVDVVPDARGWSEKLRAQIRDQTATVNVDADTGEAETKLDAVARTRTAKVKADVSQLSRGASALDNFVGKLGLLPALATAAGAALVPLAGVIGGVVAALAAPLAIAGGGATLFGILGGLAVKQTLEQSKNVDKLKASVDSARQSLENARRSAGKNAATSASVANAQKRLNEATAEYQSALKGVSPQQTAFLAALDGLKSTFQDLLGGPTGRALLAPLTAGLQTLGYVLRAAEPFITAASKAFGTLMEDLLQQVNSPAFDKFIQLFSRQVFGDLVQFGRIFGNVVKGFGGLFLGLDKAFGGSVLHNLLRLSRGFADFGANAKHSQFLKDFVDYFHKVGPQVGDTLGAVARAIGHIVKALAPLGPVVLSGIEHMADGISNIPIPVLTALAAAFVSITAFQKLGGFKGLAALGNLTGASGKGGVVGGLLSGGVQKVYVVNLPPSLGGPGAGVPGTPGTPTTGVPGKPIVPISTIGGLAALMTIGDSGNEVLTPKPVPGFNAQTALLDYLRKQNVHTNSQVQALPKDLITGILSRDQIRGALNITELKKMSGAFDAVKAHAALASRQIDLIGPHTQSAAGVGIKAIDQLQNRVQALHDKRFRIIAETQSAIAALERLQAFRIADKHFTVYQRSQQLDRVVGPRGGQGQNPHGSGSGHGGSGGSGSGGSSGGSSRTPVTLQVDDEKFSAWMDNRINDNYHANRNYEHQAAGR
jgi:hypothetical protein